MDYPIIYDKTYITENCEFAFSSGSGLEEKLYDRNPDTQWLSSGETDEDGDYSTYIEISLKEGTSETNRTFDYLILLNTNIKAYRLKGWGGSMWSTIFTETNNSSTNIIYQLVAPYTFQRIRIEIDKTISAGQEKKIGELILTQKLYTFTDYLSSYKPYWAVKEDNDRDSNYKLNSWYLQKKYICEWSMEFQNSSQRDSLIDIFKDKNKFLWQPEPEAVPQDIFLCRWIQNFDRSYTRLMKTVGYNLSGRFEEI